MKFLDYIFYRSYVHYEKNNDMPMLTSVVLVSTVLICLTSFVWFTIIDLFTCKLPKYHGYLVALPIYFIVYLRYRKEKNDILIRYKDSKYNKIIPLWSYFVLLLLCFAFGIVITHPIHKYIVECGLRGVFA